MKHEVQIAFDERYMVRPWSAMCSCGWRSANITEREAQQSKKIHLEQHATD